MGVFGLRFWIFGNGVAVAAVCAATGAILTVFFTCKCDDSFVLNKKKILFVWIVCWNNEYKKMGWAWCGSLDRPFPMGGERLI